MDVIKNLNIPALRDEKKMVKYALKKNSKSFRVLTKDIVLDNVFQDLETKKDAEGNIIDTRFSTEIQSYIRDFLMAKGYSFEDTGYLSLRSACYDLKYDDRLELCRNINAKFDMNKDVEGPINKSKGFFDKFKDSSSMIVGGTVLGATGGAVLNATNANLVPNAIGEASKGIINNNLGALGGIANNFVSNSILSNTLPVNLVSGAAAGLTAGAMGAAATSLFGIVKNGVNRITASKENKKFMEVDNELYKEDNLEEAKLIYSKLNAESGIEIEGFDGVALAQ